MCLRSFSKNISFICWRKRLKYPAKTKYFNRIDGVLVSVLASSEVDSVFGSWFGQRKNYKIGIYCFSTKHTALRSKSKDWLARNKNSVSEWSTMSIRGQLFQ